MTGDGPMIQDSDFESGPTRGRAQKLRAILDRSLPHGAAGFRLALLNLKAVFSFSAAKCHC